ncbi:hypothetical protein [Rhizobium sp. 'Codium 1']|uniref:hypothetical protein n=1 Tax=Rhizobium sp. 'Codium 1' TaxID=2940484 RepID=UPI001E53EAB1|nr:hypothetical protein [Rhizobium sp. 'Codium 1']MCC8934881.1 hypothetical protein [Rhizobium sp. 'Codium 1']
MTDEMRSTENLASDEKTERVIVYSDLLRAARAGWLWILGLTLVATVVSVVWDARRPPLFEANATVRIGWVHDGFSIVPIEPIEDLVIMMKQESFLKPVFEGLNVDSVSDREKNEFSGTLSIKWAPKSNMVEFKNFSTSKESARVLLERLISFKVAQHEKIVNDFFASRQQMLAECNRLAESGNQSESADLLGRCSAQQLTLAHLVPPLMAHTVVSQSVNVAERAVFPSLYFLIVASVLGGLVFGTLFSFVLGIYKRPE